MANTQNLPRGKWPAGGARWLCAGVIFLITTGADAGVIHTFDGKTLEGKIRLDSGQSLHITDAQGRETGVKLSRVLDVSFVDPLPVLSRGVVLVDGVSVAGNLDSISEKSVRISPAGMASLEIKNEQIARVVFQPLPAETLAKAPPRMTGLLLRGGDFFEGDLGGFDGHTIRINSSLLGSADFDTTQRAVALIYRKSKPLSAAMILRTTAGSELAVQNLSIDHGQWHFIARGLGDMSLPPQAVAQITAENDQTPGSGRISSLWDLAPTEGATTLIDQSTDGLSDRLPGVDPAVTRIVPAAATVSYPLNGDYEVLTLTAGLPADAVPMVPITITVTADAKVLAAVTQSSVADPARISVNVSGAQKVSIRTSCELPTQASVLLGEARLVRRKITTTVEPPAPVEPEKQGP